MANIKITELAELTSAASSDVLPVVDVSDGATKKVKPGNLVIAGAKELARGTQDAPAVAFGGATDANTGIYSPGADQVALSTGGTGRLFIDSIGRVGINNDSPGLALDVTGPVRSVNGTIDLRLQAGASGAAGVGSFSSHPLLLIINSQERLRIDSSGRLLVGTGSDSGGALLQVNGDRVRVATSKTPASATATGTAGEICWDASYVYVCTATNTWKRSALSTW